jgi:glutaryl-CoA dehydrogenase
MARVVVGVPLFLLNSSFQPVQEKLAGIYTELVKAELLAFRLGQLAERGEATFLHVSFAKRNNVAAALAAARTARELLGANGITDEYPAMRHLENLESVSTYEGTHDVHILILGKELTGIAAFV